jgi:hypothetical protein
MISILYSVICFIIIYLINISLIEEYKSFAFYLILIVQGILTTLLRAEDKYCITQLRNKLNQSYILLNDCYCKKKV